MKCAVAVLCSLMFSSLVVHAQSGRWHQSAVMSRAHVGAWGLGVYDSVVLYVLVDTGFYHRQIFRSSDGGRSWRSTGELQAAAYRNVEYPWSFVDSNLFCVTTNGDIQSITDGGEHAERFDGPWRGYHLRATRLMAPGQALIIGADPNVPRVVESYRTTDSFKTYSLVSSLNMPYTKLFDARFLGNYEIWLLLRHSYFGATTYLLHTTNEAVDWDTVYHDSSRLEYPDGLVFSPDPQRMYIYGSMSPSITQISPGVSYMESIDGGHTWRDDSSIYGRARIKRMAAPATNELWAIVTSKDSYDTLVHSSDGGGHWSVVPEMLGDTLVDLIWPDSTHGFVLGQRNDSVFVYRYTRESAGVRTGRSSPGHLQFADVVVTYALRYEYTGAEQTRAEIYDPLGRLRSRFTLQPNSNGSINVSDLPISTYYIRISSAAGLTEVHAFQKE